MHDREPNSGQCTGKEGSVLKRGLMESKLWQRSYNLPRVAPSDEGVSNSHTVLPRERRGVERAEIS